MLGKRRTLALKHLHEKGPAGSRALATAIHVAHNNLAYFMTPLVEMGAVTREVQNKRGDCIYTITDSGRDLAVRLFPPRPRFDPADPFGLLAKLRAARTASRHPTALTT